MAAVGQQGTIKCGVCQTVSPIGTTVCPGCKLPLTAFAQPGPKTEGEPVHVSDATFDQEVLQSEQPVLVDFWATWCGPCRALAPIVDEVATQYSGRLKVAKMDVDHNQATPMRYGIRGIPALLIFKGGKVADQIVGYVPKETIERSITRVLG